jgi:hypothetical protein
VVAYGAGRFLVSIERKEMFVVSMSVVVRVSSTNFTMCSLARVLEVPDVMETTLPAAAPCAGSLGAVGIWLGQNANTTAAQDGFL